jgi:hypothetical protein
LSYIAQKYLRTTTLDLNGILAKTLLVTVTKSLGYICYKLKRLDPRKCILSCIGKGLQRNSLEVIKILIDLAEID